MAGIYFGVGGVARKVKNAYIGVGSVARKVKNGYVGVAGVARKFYTAVVSPLAILTNGTPDTSNGMLSYGALVKDENDGSGATRLQVSQLSDAWQFRWIVTYNDWYGIVHRISNAVNLDGYSKVQIVVSTTLEKNNFSKFGISATKTETYVYYNVPAGKTYTSEVKISSSVTKATYTLDVSAINGNAYLYIDQNSCGWEKSDDWGNYDNYFQIHSITLIE